MFNDDTPDPAKSAVDAIIKNGLRQARRLVVLVVGCTVLLLGIVMLITPGPAFVVIPVGLGILALEFAWARRLLRRVQHHINRTLAVTEKNEGQKPSATIDTSSSTESTCQKEANAVD